jgi:hypothetical protein
VFEYGLTEDRYMKWVQLLTTANCCVHHEHVYAFTEQNPDDDDNVDTVHVTEYVMGNNGDYFPEGTGKLLYAGSKFRFAPHYHPWGEEVHDISRVGIKFYPRGEVPDLEVTSHRIRTGIGNDWTLNREKVEDLLLKQGIDLPLEGDAPLEPFLSEGNVNSLAQLSIPPHTVARSERFLRLEHAAAPEMHVGLKIDDDRRLFEPEEALGAGHSVWRDAELRQAIDVALAQKRLERRIALERQVNPLLQ